MPIVLVSELKLTEIGKLSDVEIATGVRQNMHDIISFIVYYPSNSLKATIGTQWRYDSFWHAVPEQMMS